jgi:transposase
MVEGTEGSHHKEGSTKMGKYTTVCAGIDTGKHKLDVAIDGGAQRVQVDNNSQGHRSLSAWLRQREVERIGIEASGGYEQAVSLSLRRTALWSSSSSRCRCVLTPSSCCNMPRTTTSMPS